MNVEQLQQTLRDIKGELEATQTENQLQAIEASLQQAINSPSDAGVQQQFEREVQQLRNVLQAAIDKRPEGPIWLHYVNELHLGDLTAKSILVRVDAIFQQAQLTQAIALQAFTQLRNDISQKRLRVMSILDGLDSLNIEQRGIPPDKAEVVVLIPRGAIDNNLDKFGAEAKRLNTLLKVMAEATTGKIENVELQSLSTTDPIIVVLLSSIAALNFSKAVSYLVGCYEKIYRIHGHSAALKDEGLPKEAQDVVNKFTSGIINIHIEQATKEIMKVGPAAKDADEKQRKNEVRNHLAKELEALAKRIKLGYKFDVRPSDEPSDANEPEQKKISEEISQLRGALSFKSLEGGALLELPGGDDDDETPAEGQDGADK